MQRLMALCVALLASGCATIAGTVMHDAREQFNETAQVTNAEQLLRNIVRLRYAQTPYFLEITSVTTSATMAGSLALSANTVGALPGLSPNTVVVPSASFSQTPTFVFQPLAGEKFARQLLRPVDLRTLALLRTAGWDLRDILIVLVDGINGVANAPAATQFAPRVIPDNTAFLRVVDLIDLLEDSGQIELGLDATATPADGRGDIVLSLSIDKAAGTRPEVQELVRLLALDPNVLTYRLAAAAGGGGGRNIAIKPRSVLAAMRYLSKGVAVAESDLAAGIAPAARNAGRLPAEAALLERVFRVHSADEPPSATHVRIRHDGRWYWIERNDLASKHTFGLMETAFALQGGDVPPISTMLTLPIAR
jgi:hypothetical protein